MTQRCRRAGPPDRERINKLPPHSPIPKCLIYMQYDQPVLLVLLGPAGHPPAVDGAVHAGVPKAGHVAHRHIEEEVKLSPGVVHVPQLQVGEICGAGAHQLTHGLVFPQTLLLPSASWGCAFTGAVQL